MRFDNIVGTSLEPRIQRFSIGTGSKLDTVCEYQANVTRSLAQDQKCDVSEVQNTHFVSDNYTEDLWSFSVHCNLKQANIIDAIDNILDGLMMRR